MSIEPDDLRSLVRDISPRILSALVRRFGDFADAEEALQDALMSANARWPKEGWPKDPFAWLLTVASRRLIDRVRQDVARKRREQTVFQEQHEPHDEQDTIHFLFLCCHPALSEASAIALTLRAVAGLSTEQIARAFMVPARTMAQRISRAKRKIRESPVLAQPADDYRKTPELKPVMRVLYLMFNEGYLALAGAKLQRVDLAEEAIFLTRKLHSLVVEPEVQGLLALMLFSHSRRGARTGPHGELVPLADQDRSLWDTENIREGQALLGQALRQGPPGIYQVQAAIHALHCEARDVSNTDWPQILGLYQLLGKLDPNPMIALNGAIALAMVEGPESGLQMIRQLEDHSLMRKHHRLFTVRGHLYEMADQPEKAMQDFRSAARKTDSLPERDYLSLKVAQLGEGIQASGKMQS